MDYNNRYSPHTTSVTQRAIHLTDDAMLVTTTDLNGVITYANPDFIKISGYTEQELIGSNHSLVRHPDMPGEAFRDLWSTLKRGDDWVNFVKNRAKNGDHYWVKVYISAIYDGDRVTGYRSVCIKPTAKEIIRAEKIYKSMRENPGKEIPRHRSGFHDFSIKSMILAFSSLFVVIQVAFLFLGHFSSQGAWLDITMDVFDIAMPALVYFFLRAALKPIDEISRVLLDISHGNLRNPIRSISRNEIGQIAACTQSVHATLLTMIGSMKKSSDHLGLVSVEMAAGSSQSVAALKRQSEQTEMIAAAINEMTATVQDIATNAAHTAETVSRAKIEVKDGLIEIQKTHEVINGLSGEIYSAAHAIESLKTKGTAISNIVKLISGIADQTNLLSLNAAIEAARAGQYGRGFSVVANEVRELALKTQESTVDIREIIESLIAEINSTVEVVHAGQIHMDIVKDQAASTESALVQIASSVDLIDSMTLQIATATEEQSMVSEEMNRNIHVISEKTEQTAKLSRENAALGVDIAANSDRLNSMLSGFATGEKSGQLAAMKAAHLAWRSKVRAYIDGDKTVLTHASAIDPHQCTLGHWYHNEGMSKFGHMREFIAIDTPHKELHATIKSILDAVDSGKRLESEKFLPDVDRLSAEVIRRIDELNCLI